MIRPCYTTGPSSPRGGNDFSGGLKTVQRCSKNFRSKNPIPWGRLSTPNGDRSPGNPQGRDDDDPCLGVAPMDQLANPPHRPTRSPLVFPTWFPIGAKEAAQELYNVAVYVGVRNVALLCLVIFFASSAQY